jgi:uncharacterized membrane protein YtjA (UPF0391 family)
MKEKSRHGTLLQDNARAPKQLPANALAKGTAMTILQWALIMLVVSLVAAPFGCTDLAAASADVARVLFYIFVVTFLVLLVLRLTIFRSARGP